MPDTRTAVELEDMYKPELRARGTQRCERNAECCEREHHACGERNPVVAERATVIGGRRRETQCLE